MLMNFGIAQDCWGHDPERGRVRNITVDGVTIYGDTMPHSSLGGADADHDIRGVTVKGVRLSGRPAATPEALRLRTNDFVSDVTISQ